MKIVEVVVRYFPYVGGVENTVRQLALALRRRGHDVRVVCAEVPPGAPAEVDGVPVTRLRPLARLGLTPLAPGIVRAVLAERPDLVHGHMTPPWWLDAAARAARRARVPFVATYNNDVVGTGLLGAVAAAYNRSLLPSTLRSAARIVVPNPRVAEQSAALAAAMVRERVVSIPWGVDLTRFAPGAGAAVPGGMPAPRPPRAGFLALLDAAHDYKGLDDLLAALALARAAPDSAARAMRLTVAGDGDQLDRYRRRAADLGLGEAVDFAGFVPEDRLADFYRSCDLFVLPSRSLSQEGFGLVLLEALACGIPVVTSTVPAAAAAIHEAGAGWVIEPRDVAALATALRDAAADPAERARRGERGRRLVERRFGWDAVGASYEALFRSLTGPGA